MPDRQQDIYYSFIGNLVQVDTTKSENPTLFGILLEYHPRKWFAPGPGYIVLQGRNKIDLPERNLCISDNRFRLLRDVKSDYDNAVHRIPLDQIVDAALLQKVG